MQSANLLVFGQGGGLFGDDRDATLNNFRFSEHSFEKLGEDKKTVIERFPPGCMMGFDISLHDRSPEEPEVSTQWYPVGDLPAARYAELGLPARQPMPGQKAQTGGYRPSLDNENSAPEGPFVVLEGRSDIWGGAPYSQFMGELITQGLANYQDRVAAQGIAALNGIQVHLGAHDLPKSKKAIQEERLTGRPSQAKTILVVKKVIAWPWDAAAATQPSAAPVAAAPATPAAAAPATGGNGSDIDAKAVDFVVKAIAAKGGFLEKAQLGVALMPFISREGASRGALMQKANNEDFLAAHSGSAWIWDAASQSLATKQ